MTLPCSLRVLGNPDTSSVCRPQALVVITTYIIVIHARRHRFSKASAFALDGIISHTLSMQKESDLSSRSYTAFPGDS